MRNGSAIFSPFVLFKGSRGMRRDGGDTVYPGIPSLVDLQFPVSDIKYTELSNIQIATSDKQADI